MAVISTKTPEDKQVQTEIAASKTLQVPQLCMLYPGINSIGWH
jgi:hypothetical protein